MREICWLAEQLLVCQEGLPSTELLSSKSLVLFNDASGTAEYIQLNGKALCE